MAVFLQALLLFVQRSWSYASSSDFQLDLAPTSELWSGKYPFPPSFSLFLATDTAQETLFNEEGEEHKVGIDDVDIDVMWQGTNQLYKGLGQKFGPFSGQSLKLAYNPLEECPIVNVKST
jgi:hypothetical protein